MYQRASDCCMPVCRTSSRNWTWYPLRSSLFGIASMRSDMQRPAPTSAKFVTWMNGLRISCHRIGTRSVMFDRTAASCPP